MHGIFCPHEKRTSATEECLKDKEATQDHILNIRMNTFFDDFDITSQKSDKTTKKSNSPSKETNKKQNKKKMKRRSIKT